MFEEMKSAEPAELETTNLRGEIDYSNNSEEEANLREAQPMIESTIVQLC